MPACALIRHAFNCYYYELVTVATNPEKKFYCEHVFAKTMHSFRNAVLAYCKGLEIQQLSLRYSGKPTSHTMLYSAFKSQQAHSIQC